MRHVLAVLGLAGLLQAQAEPGSGTELPGLQPGWPPLLELQVGEGTALEPGMPFLCTFRLYHGSPAGAEITRRPTRCEGICGLEPYPGLGRVLPGMRPGGQRRTVMEITEFFELERLQRSQLPQYGQVTVEVTLDEVPPLEPLDVEVVTPGTGEATVADGTTVRLELTGWTDGFDGQKEFESTRDQGESLALQVGDSDDQVRGVHRGIVGMRVGEVRNISVPWYLGYGSSARPGVPARARLYYTVRLLEIVPPGEVTVQITGEGDGERAAARGDYILVEFTGWLDGFGGDRVFDLSQRRNQPFGFQLGKDDLTLDFWHTALEGMRQGETRRIKVPFNEGYGLQAWPRGRHVDPGTPFRVPPASTLFYEVTLTGFVDPGELGIEVVQPGTGSAVESGDTVNIHYTGWLDGIDGEQQFETSRDKGRSFPFTTGGAEVVEGLEQGLAGMRVGERRHLVIPFNLAYGARGYPPRIPPFATLYFDIELVSIDGK